jgi:hypothetical protein
MYSVYIFKDIFLLANVATQILLLPVAIVCTNANTSDAILSAFSPRNSILLEVSSWYISGRRQTHFNRELFFLWVLYFILRGQ